MSRKRSRFLRKPVEPFAVAADVTADDLLTRMERISFQGRNLATARRIWERMLASDATIFLGTAGALSAGGMRLIIAHLIEHRYIDCLVSTGANLYHDLHEVRGRRHFIGSPGMDDAALAAERIDRVYDTLASEDEFCRNDEWIAAFVLKLERRPYTTREFLYKLGEYLWKETGHVGILTAAYRANVPIFCPALADSSIGMGISGAPEGRHRGQIDVIGDIIQSANIVIAAVTARSSSAAARQTSSTRRACRPSSIRTSDEATSSRCRLTDIAPLQRRSGAELERPRAGETEPMDRR